MAKDPRPPQRPQSPAPPPPKARSQRPRDLTPYAKTKPLSHEQVIKETEAHAKQVRAVLRGKDGELEWQDHHEKPPAAFEHEDMLVVRNWLKRRPVEAPPQAA